MVLQEDGLLIRREPHHSKLVFAMERRKNALIHTEIRMPHVTAFPRTFMCERDVPETLRGYTSRCHRANSAMTRK
jgi:hypothetical protein